MAFTIVNTAKSARRAIVLTLLGVLALPAAFVIAAGGNADFTVSASPSSQAISAGEQTTYTITLTRENKHTDPVTLAVTGLPSKATGTFSPNPIAKPATGTTVQASTMTVQTNVGGATPTGTYKLTITGKDSKNVTRSTTATLVVQSPGTPNFTLSASPASLTVVQSDDASYTLTVTRLNSFSGTVSLSASGVPAHTSATFNPNPILGSGTSSTLTLATTDKTKAGSYAITITGTSGTLTRTAAVTLVVEDNKPFLISGDLATGLAPGISAPLDLVLTNPHNFTINVQNLSAHIEEATSKPGCRGTVDFSISQIPSGRYPIAVPANSTRTLTALGIPDSDKPRISMPNLGTSQDDCKGAQLHFQYSGTATK